MTRNHTYHVKYKMYFADEVHGIDVIANSKETAWFKAVYEMIEEIPYSAWTASVTYNNGKAITFNTHDGKPY